MPVTKSDLVEQLSSMAKLPKGKAELVINVMFDSMIEALQRGARIEIRGFGSFEVRDYKAYEGRNPRTGETVYVPAKRLPFFKVGKELRERINNQAGTDGHAAAPRPAAAPGRPGSPDLAHDDGDDDDILSASGPG
ncbi:HU family DNA-binding protein [Haliangium sp.]|uniref:HU family DNA-binding protein n=1 Tax=Haliangium sp. TaxID=2663208 RepID=UPI003D1088BF